MLTIGSVFQTDKAATRGTGRIHYVVHGDPRYPNGRRLYVDPSDAGLYQLLAAHVKHPKNVVVSG